MKPPLIIRFVYRRGKVYAAINEKLYRACKTESGALSTAILEFSNERIGDDKETIPPKGE